jgi:hypothetical protein
MKFIVIFLLLGSFLWGHGVEVTVEKNYPAVIVKVKYHHSKALINANVTIGFQDEKKEFQKGNTDQNGVFCFCPDRAGQWTVIVDDLLGHRGKKTIAITEDFFKISSPPAEEKKEVVPKIENEPQKDEKLADKSPQLPVEEKKEPSSKNEFCCYLLKIVLGVLFILIVTFIFYRLKKRGEKP